MKFPKTNEDFCPVATQTGCEDDRCADPVFAVAHPDICGVGNTTTGRLILKPERAVLCDQNQLQFAAFLAGDKGEQPLTAGVTYSSSNIAVITINASTGLATVVAVGEATISIAWQTQTASSIITVLGGAGDCCSGLAVRVALLVDYSASMRQAYAGGESRLLHGYYLWKYGIRPGMSFHHRYHTGTPPNQGDGRSFEAYVKFARTAGLAEDWDYVDVPGPVPNPDPTATDIAGAFALAVSLFESAPVDAARPMLKAIILISDGADRPELSADARYALIQAANDFKIAGGVVVCLGMRASGDGYSLLSQLSSIGYFLNALPTVGDQLGIVERMMCQLCAAATGTRGCDESTLTGLVPHMTAIDQPSGHIRRFLFYAGAYQEEQMVPFYQDNWKMFDLDDGTYVTNMVDDGRGVAYQFPVGASVSAWRVRWEFQVTPDTILRAGVVRLKASNDGGASWTVLDERNYSASAGVNDETYYLAGPASFVMFMAEWKSPEAEPSGYGMPIICYTVQFFSEDCSGTGNGCDAVNAGAQSPDPNPLPEAEA